MSEPSAYDAIARLYDPWSRSVTEDVPFYVEEARRAGGGQRPGIFGLDFGRAPGMLHTPSGRSAAW